MARAPVHLPSIGSLRAFEAAARLGNFTAAAAELAQTQGAVSHQVKELEQRLGIRLFVRGPRGTALTADGRQYLPYAESALASLRAGARVLTRASDDRVLTVSMSPNFAARWLVPRLGRFASQHPDIDLRISATMEHVTFSGDGIDMAVRHGTGEWPALHVRRLATETIFPVCAPALRERLGAPVTARTLADAPLLHDGRHDAWRDWLIAAGATIDERQLAAGPVFNQAALVLDAAVAGQGVALARSALVALDLAAGRLVRIGDTERPAPFAYWLVCPADAADEVKVRRFSDWLVDEAHADARASPRSG